jgi:hypothetical protein
MRRSMMMGILDYDKITEEGKVFIDMDALPDDVVGLDILQDWICDLQAIYAARHAEVFKPKGE